MIPQTLQFGRHNVTIVSRTILRGEDFEIWAADKLITAVTSPNSYQSVSYEIDPGNYILNVKKGVLVVPNTDATSNNASVLTSVYIKAASPLIDFELLNGTVMSKEDFIEPSCQRLLVCASTSVTFQAKYVRVYFQGPGTSYYQGLRVITDGLERFRLYQTECWASIWLTIQNDHSVTTVFEGWDFQYSIPVGFTVALGYYK